MIYWIRIVLGALVVFGLGMGVVALMRSGGERLETIAEIPRVMATIPDRFYPLTIDGVEAGNITRLQIDPEDDMTVTLAAIASATSAGTPLPFNAAISLSFRTNMCASIAGTIDALTNASYAGGDSKARRHFPSARALTP